MHHQPIATTRRRTSAWGGDLVRAALLAAALSACWAVRTWSELGRLTLPDPDDMMRLAQVRDWLAGQGLNDWTQYRMAPPLGAPMHWSRVNDFGIAAIIFTATPVLGRHAAELVAVIVYPGLLFTATLTLAARIARRLWDAAAAPIAILLAAIAYPGTTLFVPGRIDHHALQVVLILTATLALTRGPTLVSGAAAGAAIALSLVTGLETAPQAAALLAATFVLWAVRGHEERARLAALAAALLGVTSFFLIFFRPTYWNAALCDAFTPASSTAMLAGGATFGVLALATPLLREWRARALIGGALGAAVLGGVLLAYPACVTGPYGRVDPFLLREFIPHIEEANSLLALPLLKAFSIGGLMIAACAASAWMIARRPGRWARTLPIVAVIAMSALVMLAQVRGTYLGAPAAAPVMAGLVVAARRRTHWRTPAVLGAWLVGAGTTYLGLAGAVQEVAIRVGAIPLAAAGSPNCTKGDVWEQINHYAPGLAMAPTYMASYSLGATRLATVGAGYHRNNRGNMAMYRYFLSPPAQAAVIAREWRARYVLFCPGDFSEMHVMQRFPRSLAAALQRDQPPPGFERLPLRNAPLRFYRIAP